MDQLEIFIFTYNRAESLRRTLAEFSGEPIRNCRLTVLDNCSTDNTPEVCAAAKTANPNLHVVRHPRNIGGLANYLRGIELARAKYTWVICDDDSFDFSKAVDVFEEIERGETDVISVGVNGHVLPANTRGGLYNFSLQHPFFWSHSFVPSMIFRTELFDGDCLRGGYENIDTMFPHFPFLIRLAEDNRSVYVSREKVITKSNNVGYSTFRFMAGWLKSCRRFKSTELRRKVTGEVFSGESFIKTVIFSLLMERQFRPNQFRREYRELRSEAARTDRLIWLKLWMFSSLLMAPGFVHQIFWKKYERYRERKGAVVPNFDEER
jgi:glycosyltransferase involved in cell wall biosynthesis